MSTKTLQDALKEILRDDQKVSKYEARVVREMIMGDLQVTDQEREFLEQALKSNQFDEQAVSILKELL